MNRLTLNLWGLLKPPGVQVSLLRQLNLSHRPVQLPSARLCSGQWCLMPYYQFFKYNPLHTRNFASSRNCTEAQNGPGRSRTDEKKETKLLRTGVEQLSGDASSDDAAQPHNRFKYALRQSNGAQISGKITKEELLKRTPSIIGRMALRWKWLMIRHDRPYNADDLSAMFSWVILGHILWIVLGTTTFLSILIWAVSKVRAEDYLATWVGNFVTKETGIRVVFEEAFVPDWKKGAIVMHKVFVSRRPGCSRQSVRIGSQAAETEAVGAGKLRGVAEQPDIAGTAVAGDDDADPNSLSSAAAPGARSADVSNGSDGGPVASSVLETEADDGDAVDDGNYTQYDLTIDSVLITVSARQWFAGRGLVHSIEIKGLRGVVDRRFLRWDDDWDAVAARNQPKRGDFDFSFFRMEDVLVTVLQPGGAKPFELGIHVCDLPRLRQQWLLYDFLNSNNMSGVFDNSLFTLHRRQIQSADDGKSIRVQRLRIDDVDVRHLNYGVSGMFGWIESGTVDFLADITLPDGGDSLNFGEKVQDLLERWQAQLRGGPRSKIVTSVDRNRFERESHKCVSLDLRVQFNNTRAKAPLYSPDLNYLNNALIHPMVAYINSHDTYISIRCRVIKRLSDFDGSWTFYDSRLMDDVSEELYIACAQNAADEELRLQRLRKVGFYSLQFMAQLVLLTLGIVA